MKKTELKFIINEEIQKILNEYSDLNNSNMKSADMYNIIGEILFKTAADCLHDVFKLNSEQQEIILKSKIMRHAVDSLIGDIKISFKSRFSDYIKKNMKYVKKELEYSEKF